MYIIICSILSHYNVLINLPDIKKDWYINSNGNTCKKYSLKSWEIVGRVDEKVIITNKVINVEGFYYGKRRKK